MVNVVWKNPTDITRVAEIDGKFYPYNWSLERAQVTFGNNFAGHTNSGIKYVSRPFDTLKQAKAAIYRQVAGIRY